jgi:hypothetical protein
MEGNDMNAEKRTIAILAVTAILLLLAVILVPRPATAMVTLKGGDYLVCTHGVAAGGDALYIADTRMGVLGVFVFDPGSRSLQLRAICPVAAGFMPGQ